MRSRSIFEEKPTIFFHFPPAGGQKNKHLAAANSIKTLLSLPTISSLAFLLLLWLVAEIQCDDGPELGHVAKTTPSTRSAAHVPCDANMLPTAVLFSQVCHAIHLM